MSAVAALYVETNGCYFDLPGVEPWDQQRDARRYEGPLSVVAHPPCQRWGKMALVNYSRWGGVKNMPANDGGCFASALHAVRLWGGVLEHPAYSYAWDWFGLLKPKGIGWHRSMGGDWVCEVWQSAYGHKANKATWLFYSGDLPPPELNWERPVGTHQVGFQDQRGKARNKPTLSKAEANATPIKFRDALIAMALNAKRSPTRSPNRQRKETPMSDTQSRPVLITTKHRGVFFGYASDTSGVHVHLKNARCCIRWRQMKGFMELATDGPNEHCRIGPAADFEARDVTSIAECTEKAVKAWEGAPWAR